MPGCHAGGTPNYLGLARAKAPQITSETKEAAKTCRVITDKHLIYSGYTGWWGGETTNHKQTGEGRNNKPKGEGKSTRRGESKSVNHRGCCSSPDPPLVFSAWEILSLQILQGGAWKLGV